MQHKKIIEILVRLDFQQIERLYDFVRSPFYNKNNYVTALFEFLRSKHPDFPAEEISDETILKKVKGITEAKGLSRKMSLLLHLVEKFLSIEHSSDPVLERIGTLKAYKKMHLPKHFEPLALQLHKELEKELFKDFDYLWRMHKLEEEFFEGFDQVLNRTSENSVSAVIRTLVRFYLTKKLRYLTEASNRKRLLGKYIEDDFREEMLAFLDESKDFDLYLSLYGNLYRMNLEKSPDEAMPYYQKLKTLIKEYSIRIPKEELRSIYVYLQNYCLNVVNKGNKKYLRDFLEIIQLRIKKEILLEDNRINPQLYKNIVGASIMLNETAWAEKFINDFRNFLPEDFRNDYYHLALGQLLYHNGDLKRASHHLILASHNKKDVYFSFAVKKLLLKIGYESNDFALDSYIESYRKHLDRYRTKIGENGNLLEKFYKYFRLIVKANRDKEELESILSQLLTDKSFPDKDWLVRMATFMPVKPKTQKSFDTRKQEAYQSR